MRSLKLLAIALALTALVAGPVMAQEAMPPAGDTMAAPADTAKPIKAKKHKKHTTGKKHHKKKATSDDGMAVGK